VSQLQPQHRTDPVLKFINDINPWHHYRGSGLVRWPTVAIRLHLSRGTGAEQFAAIGFVQISAARINGSGQQQPLIAEIDVVGAASETGRCNRYRDLPRMWREAEGHCLYRGAGIDCQDSGACVATPGI